MPRRARKPEAFIGTQQRSKLLAVVMGDPWTNLVFVLLVSTGLACAATNAQDPPIGVSGVADDSPLIAPVAPADAKPDTSRLSEFSNWRDVARFVSRGHVPLANSGRASRIVASSDMVADAYLQRADDAAFPPGSGLAQLFAADAAGPWTVAYVMERTRNGWRYTVTTASGAAEKGPSELCSACHERPARTVFGPPSVASAVAPKTTTK